MLTFKIHLVYRLPFIIFSFLLLVLWLTPEALAIENEKKEKKDSDKSVSMTDKPASSSSTSTAATILPPISKSKQSKEDLQYYLSGDEITPILAGPDEYLTIISKNKYKHSKGVVILLPDWQQTIVSNNAINYLRSALTQQGWNTIAIQPSEKPQEIEGFATLTSEEQQKEHKKTLQNYQQKLSTLMKAVIKKARKYPGIFIVIAQGNHGAMLVNLYQQGENSAPSGLILLSSYMNSSAEMLEQANTTFAKTLAESSYPVLDLYLKLDHPTVNNKVKQRKSMAEQEMKIYYRQRQLNNTTSGRYPDDALLSQINRWLKSIGW